MLALVHPSADVSAHRSSSSSSSSSTTTQTVTATQLPQRPPAVIASSSRKSATSVVVPLVSSSSLSSSSSSSSPPPPALHRHQTAPSASHGHASRQSSSHHHHHHLAPSSQQSQQQQRPSHSTTHTLPPKQLTPTPSTSSSSPSTSTSTTPPVDIHTYPTTDLLKLLASLLTQIASTNDQLSTNSSSTVTSTSSTAPIYADQDTPLWHSLTTASRSAISTPASTLTFHARNIPTITLEAYFLRILKYCPTTNEVFLALLVYFDRMSKLSADATGRTFVIDSYNIHRLVIAGVTVASKFFSDVFYTNSRYAKVGGLPLPELNQLELQFLLLNDFRLVISSDEMQRYAEQLILFSRSSGVMGSGAVGRSDNTATTTTTTNNGIIPTTIGSNGVGSAAPAPTSGAGGNGAVAAPMSAMGAIDAYGGKVPDHDDAYRTQQQQQQKPVHLQELQHSASASGITPAPTIHEQGPAVTPSTAAAEEEEDDTETEIGEEEEEDDCDEVSSSATGTTDDEPTIRAASVADRARRRESIDEVMAMAAGGGRERDGEDERMGSP